MLSNKVHRTQFRLVRKPTLTHARTQTHAHISFSFSFFCMQDFLQPSGVGVLTAHRKERSRMFQSQTHTDTRLPKLSTVQANCVVALRQ